GRACRKCLMSKVSRVSGEKLPSHARSRGSKKVFGAIPPRFRCSPWTLGGRLGGFPGVFGKDGLGVTHHVAGLPWTLGGFPFSNNVERLNKAHTRFGQVADGVATGALLPDRRSLVERLAKLIIEAVEFVDRMRSARSGVRVELGHKPAERLAGADLKRI